MKKIFSNPLTVLKIVAIIIVAIYLGTMKQFWEALVTYANL